MKSIKRQLGFIYLTTGANGTGKTLFTLEDVRKRQLAENRPVYFHGFDMDETVQKEFGWLAFDPLKWEDCPNGSLFIMDEVHNQMPRRHAGSAVPAFISALGEHRKRGFDFYLITQHPSNLDPFVTKLIGAPGYHRHVKRAGGAALSSVLQWNAVNSTCEKPSSGKSGEVTMRAFPKDVYKWYKSADLHTAKIKIPKAIWVILAAFILVPMLGYYAVSNLSRSEVSLDEPGQNEVVSSHREVTYSTKLDYFDSYVPRVPGLAYTAPRFDDVTKPIQAPYPAACVSMGSRCECYSQQSTKLQVPLELCLQIVDRGFFVEWQEPASKSVKSEESVGRKLEAPLRDEFSNGDGQIIGQMRQGLL